MVDKIMGFAGQHEGLSAVIVIAVLILAVMALKAYLGSGGSMDQADQYFGGDDNL